jgi:MarR family transcriptional regulator, lower aerobic nicotinate degradation pathway regulator
MTLELPRGAKAPGRVRDLPTWLISRNYTRSNTLLNEGFVATGTGLRPYHYRLMASIDDEGPIGQAELGRVSGIDRSDVANMLAELEELGLVERTVDPSNRRRNIVVITQAGSKQLMALGDVLDKIQERVVAPLSPNERRQLTRLLRKLLN